MSACTFCAAEAAIVIEIAHAGTTWRWCEPCLDVLVMRGAALTAARIALRHADEEASR